MIMIACYIVYYMCAGSGVNFLIRREISAFRHVSVGNEAEACDMHFRHESW